MARGQRGIHGVWVDLELVPQEATADGKKVNIFVLQLAIPGTIEDIYKLDCAFDPSAGKDGSNFPASVPLAGRRSFPDRRCVPLQQFVIQAHKRPGASGIALAGAPAVQLPVDSAGLVTLGGDHMQSPQLGHMWAQPDIGSSSGHVRCDGNAPAPAGAGDDPRLGVMPDGIEDLVIQIFGG